MNTADRSIALVDHALRRRFAFLRLNPDYELLQRFHEKNGRDVARLVELLRRVNDAIKDEDYAIGISFFLHPDLPEHLEMIWRSEIEPYLEEYFFDRKETAEEFRWDKIAQELAHLTK